jgi:hypothetical protein
MEMTQYKNKPYDEHEFSGQWRLEGFCEVLPFNQLNFSNMISPLNLLGEEMTFKNGKGKYFLVDYDHGSTRVWSERITGFWESSH